LLRLIEEVLDISGVDSGSMDLSMRAVSVDDALSVSLLLIKPFAVKHKVAIHTPTTRDLHVYADKQRLKQVLVNLLSNAVKYNHEGGTVDIGIEAMEDGLIRIAISKKIVELVGGFLVLRVSTAKARHSGLCCRVIICRIDIKFWCTHCSDR